MNRQEIQQVLELNGWKRDAHGHYKKLRQARNKATGEIKDILTRVKFQALSCRLERQTVICGKNEWLKIANDYHRNICLDNATFKDGTTGIGLRIGGTVMKLERVA